MRRWLQENGLKPGTSRAKDAKGRRFEDLDSSHGAFYHVSESDEDDGNGTDDHLSPSNGTAVMRTCDKRLLKTQLKKIQKNEHSLQNSNNSDSNNENSHESKKIKLMDDNLNGPPTGQGRQQSGEKNTNSYVKSVASSMPAHLRPPGIITTSSANNNDSNIMTLSTTNYMLEMFKKNGKFNDFSFSPSNGAMSSETDTVFDDILKSGTLLSPLGFSAYNIATANNRNTPSVHNSNHQFSPFFQNNSLKNLESANTSNDYNALPIKQRIKKSSPKYQPHSPLQSPNMESTDDTNNNNTARRLPTIDTSLQMSNTAPNSDILSPTSRAMNKLIPLLNSISNNQNSIPGGSKGLGNSKETSNVPLQILPYFKFLNTESQR
jgi:hypothetical protein